MKERLVVDAIGLVVSSGAWLSGVTLELRAQAVAVSRLPESWRFHPELREGYRLTAELRTRDLWRQRKSLMVWLGVLTGYAAALGALDIPLWGTLLVATVWASFSTGRDVSVARGALSRRTASLGLPELQSDRAPRGAVLAVDAPRKSGLLSNAGIRGLPAPGSDRLVTLRRCGGKGERRG